MKLQGLIYKFNNFNFQAYIKISKKEFSNMFKNNIDDQTTPGKHGITE